MHRVLYFSALSVLSFSVFTHALPQKTSSDQALSYELNCTPRPSTETPLDHDACEDVLTRGFEHIFKESEYRLTHKLPTMYGEIKCPYKFSNGQCQLVLDFDGEGEETRFKPKIQPAAVLRRADSIMATCVRVGGGPLHDFGGTIFPIDWSRSATLTIQKPDSGYDFKNETRIEGGVEGQTPAMSSQVVEGDTLEDEESQSLAVSK